MTSPLDDFDVPAPRVPTTAGEPPRTWDPRSRPRVVLVGAESAVVALARRLQAHPTASPVTVVGACVPQPGRAAELAAEGIPVLGRIDQVVEAVDGATAHGVLVAPGPETTGTYLPDLARRLKGAELPVLLEIRGPTDEWALPAPSRGLELSELDSPDLHTSRRVTKALFDRLGALLLLVLAALVMLLVAVAVKLESPGPVLQRQRVLGQWGLGFELYRFRTSAAGTPAGLPPSAGRTVTLGRVLRRLALDELPQLLNVLKGDMSLVGPSPVATRAGEVPVPGSPGWLQVKPGLTGLWHLRGSTGELDRPVDVDHYRRHWSLAMDVRILVRSLCVALRRR